MKINKNKIALWIITLIFSWLFYRQGAGVNYLVFTFIIFFSCLWLKHDKPGLRFWLLATGSFIAAFNVVWQHTHWAMVISILSTLALIGVSFSKGNSPIVASLNSAFSFTSSFLVRTVEWFDRKENKEDPKAKKSWSMAKLMSVLLPFVVAFIFFSLYASANQQISAFLEELNLNFITWGWVQFTLVTYIIMFGLIYPFQLDHLTALDREADNQLFRKRKKRISFNLLGLLYEFRSGNLLFFLLNILLVAFHFVDLYFMFISTESEVTYNASYLHQGVNTLIASIILAISIILYYFRSNLNFYSRNQRLKIGAYIWILLNVGLVFTTGYKNFQYIIDMGLTYKRIGVFVFLLLTLVGLLTTFLKIHYKKSNWFLFRTNSWVTYLVIFTGSFLNWDKIITQYNLEHFEGRRIYYLNMLSDNNLVELIRLKEKFPKIMDEDDLNRLEERINRFQDKQQLRGWPSWNYQDHQINKMLKP